MLVSGVASASSLYRKCTFSKGKVKERIVCAVLDGVKMFVMCVQGKVCVVHQEGSFNSLKFEFL